MINVENLIAGESAQRAVVLSGLFIYCETPIPIVKRIGIGKLNNPAQRRVMISEFQKRSALKLADRIILHSMGILPLSLLWGSYL